MKRVIPSSGNKYIGLAKRKLAQLNLRRKRLGVQNITSTIILPDATLDLSSNLHEDKAMLTGGVQRHYCLKFDTSPYVASGFTQKDSKLLSLKVAGGGISKELPGGGENPDFPYQGFAEGHFRVSDFELIDPILGGGTAIFPSKKELKRLFKTAYNSKNAGAFLGLANLLMAQYTLSGWGTTNKPAIGAKPVGGDYVIFFVNKDPRIYLMNFLSERAEFAVDSDGDGVTTLNFKIGAIKLSTLLDNLLPYPGGANSTLSSDLYQVDEYHLVLDDFDDITEYYDTFPVDTRWDIHSANVFYSVSPNSDCYSTVEILFSIASMTVIEATTTPPILAGTDGAGEQTSVISMGNHNNFMAITVDVEVTEGADGSLAWELVTEKNAIPDSGGASVSLTGAWARRDSAGGTSTGKVQDTTFDGVTRHKARYRGVEYEGAMNFSGTHHYSTINVPVFVPEYADEVSAELGVPIGTFETDDTDLNFESPIQFEVTGEYTGVMFDPLTTLTVAWKPDLYYGIFCGTDLVYEQTLSGSGSKMTFMSAAMAPLFLNYSSPSESDGSSSENAVYSYHDFDDPLSYLGTLLTTSSSHGMFISNGYTAECQSQGEYIFHSNGIVASFTSGTHEGVCTWPEEVPGLVLPIEQFPATYQPSSSSPVNNYFGLSANSAIGGGTMMDHFLSAVLYIKSDDRFGYSLVRRESNNAAAPYSFIINNLITGDVLQRLYDTYFGDSETPFSITHGNIIL